jgi:hypothetical protein
MRKVCFGILTCPGSHKRYEKFMKIHERWFIENGFTYYAIYGDPSLLGTGVDYKINGNNFYCATNEAYETLAHKLAIFYSYIYEKTSMEYVFKVDDGCLINKSNILQELNSAHQLSGVTTGPGVTTGRLPGVTFGRSDYCGGLMTPTSDSCHKGKCANKELNKISIDFTHNFNKINGIDPLKLRNIKKITYCGGGYGYGLSRNALQRIVKYKYHILSLSLSYEDVLFGQIMFLENIKPKHVEIGGYHCVK